MQISFRQEILRKLVHLSSIWMVFVMWYADRLAAFLFFAVLCVLNLIVEYAWYRKVPVIAPLYGRLFGKMLRESNGRFRPSGSPPYLASAALTILFFPRIFAVPAFLCMMFGDTAAALIGRRFGRTRFPNGKSLEGCLAFLFVDWTVVTAAYFLLFPGSLLIFAGGLTGVAAAMFAELFNEELHLDDNLSIPLLVGGGLMFGQYLSGIF